MTIRNLISNSDFSLGSSNNWANWVTAGAFDSGGGSETAPTLFPDDVTASLTYSGLTNLDQGAGANGAGQVSLDILAENAVTPNGGSSEIVIALAGTVVATITTTVGASDTATVAYSNGASGNLTDFTFTNVNTAVNLVIDLPAAIPADGNLEITVSTGNADGAVFQDDEVRIDNVQVLVDDGINADAVDDSVEVTESEANGDVDLTILTNDIGDAFGLVAVNGSSGVIGSAVDGSNGGTFTISATGDLDFDAGEDFEFLDDNESAVTTVEYTIRSPEPFDAGTQTVQTSGDVGAGGQEAFFTLSGPLLTDNDDGIVNARIDLTGATQPTYNILFVMDVSGSTGPDFGSSFAGAGDLNGDGTANNIIDAEIAALRQLSTEIGNLGFTDDEVQIGLVTFDDPNQLNPSNEIILEGTNDQSFDAGSSALSTAIATAPGVVTVSGGTDFEAALNLAITWFENQEANGDARDNNIVYFLSDGQNFSGTDFSQEASALQAIATVNAVGITAAADEVALGTIDSSGTAQEVDTLAQLNAALEPPILDATIVDFRVFVDGTEDLTIDETDLTPQGTDFVFSPTVLSGLDPAPGAVNLIRAEVDFDNDGDGTADETLINTIEIRTPIQDTATVSVTVTGQNDAPVALDDATTADEDTAITIDVLANDSDVDDEPLTITDVTGATGLVTINDNGTPNDPTDDFLDYDPNGQFDDLAPGESRVDTFIYTVSDGDLTDTATVSVTVTGLNDAPDAVDDAFTVSSDTPQALAVLANDTDPDDDIEIFDVVGATGLVTINDNGTPGDTTDDFLDYDPDGRFDSLGQGESAVDTFTYTIVDGDPSDPDTLSDTATVSVTITGVNDDPTAVGDAAFVDQGQDVVIDVLANDSDPNGDPLGILSFTQGSNGIVDRVDVNNTPTDLTDDELRYTPDFNFAGPADSFNYTATDGRGGTSTATVNVTVIPNVPPFIPEPVVFDVIENQTLAADIDATDFDSPPSVIRFAIRGTGPDDALFDIDELTGELTFRDLDPSTPGVIDTPDFEEPDDANGDNTYEIDVSLSDEFNTNTQRILVNVLDDDDAANLAPDIKAPDPFAANVLSDGPVLDFLFTTSSGVVATMTTTDPNPTDVLDLSIFGEDAARFTINDVTGELSLVAPLVDGNNLPLSSVDGDSAFEITVVVEDQDGLQDTIALNYILIGSF